MPIGLTIIVSFILFLLKKYKHPISFVFVFFIFFHTLVPHKEERFLFPLIYGLPVIIAFLIESIKLHQKKIILSVFILFNISLGIVVLFRVSRIEVFILKEYSKHNVNQSLLLYDMEHPFHTFHKRDFSNSFYELYKDVQIPTRKVERFDNMNCSNIHTNTDVFFIQTIQEDPFKKNLFLKDNCRKLYSTLPKWVMNLGLSFIYEKEYARIKSFYKCDCK